MEEKTVKTGKRGEGWREGHEKIEREAGKKRVEKSWLEGGLKNNTAQRGKNTKRKIPNESKGL